MKMDTIVFIVLIVVIVLCLVEGFKMGYDWGKDDLEMAKSRADFYSDLYKINEDIIGNYVKLENHYRLVIKNYRIDQAELNTQLREKQKFIEMTWEYELLARLVEAEAGNQELEIRRKVASVVINRVKEPKFKENTIIDIMTASGQFTLVGRGTVYDIEASDLSYQAVNDAMHQDYADGALFFISPQYMTDTSYYDDDLQLVHRGKDMSFYKFPGNK